MITAELVSMEALLLLVARELVTTLGGMVSLVTVLWATTVELVNTQVILLPTSCTVIRRQTTAQLHLTMEMH